MTWPTHAQHAVYALAGAFLLWCADLEAHYQHPLTAVLFAAAAAGPALAVGEHTIAVARTATRARRARRQRQRAAAHRAAREAQLRAAGLERTDAR